MACFLAARGRAFDVDRFIKTTRLPVAQVWRRVTPLGAKGVIDPRKRHRYSGFDATVSLYDRDAFSRQLSDAERFLRKHSRELLRLQRWRGIEEIWLDFGVVWEDTLVQVDYIPSSLVAAAGEIPLSIVISHYPDARSSPARTRKARTGPAAMSGREDERPVRPDPTPQRPGFRRAARDRRRKSREA